MARIEYYKIPWGSLEIDFPSFGPGLQEVSDFCSWARAWDLDIVSPDCVTKAVACKREHLLDFWERCYSCGPALNHHCVDPAGETLLKVQLEQLDPGKLFCLVGWKY